MSSFDLDIKSVRKLAALLTETGLNEIEYAEGDKRIRCVRSNEPTVVHSVAPLTHAPAPEIEVPQPAFTGTLITSPMVGTVYLAPEPGAAPFVKAGDTVKEGDTLLVIEAMKVMNPIKASKSGVINEIFVSDAKPVEFGETLLSIA